jgi:hypothetical protein
VLLSLSQVLRSLYGLLENFVLLCETLCLPAVNYWALLI